MAKCKMLSLQHSIVPFTFGGLIVWLQPIILGKGRIYDFASENSSIILQMSRALLIKDTS